jgi:putative transposase
MDADYGSQFTSLAWTNRLHRTRLRISVDGKGWLLDSIFIERLWRKLEYELRLPVCVGD